jgi:hypothetical protein
MCLTKVSLIKPIVIPFPLYTSPLAVCEKFKHKVFREATKCPIFIIATEVLALVVMINLILVPVQESEYYCVSSVLYFSV